MKGIVDWASDHARTVIAFVFLSLAAGIIAYAGLPKEGEPDIDIPALFVSVPFPGISSEDSEKLIVKPLENEVRDLDGLKKISSTASEGYAIVVLEFEFGWRNGLTGLSNTRLMRSISQSFRSLCCLCRGNCPSARCCAWPKSFRRRSRA